MGFKAPKQIYRLVFPEGDDLAGLEIRAVAPAFGAFLDLAKLAELVNVDKIKPEDIEKIRPVFDLFVKCVRSWNLEDDDDRPLPVSYGSLLTLDLPVLMRIVDAWMRVVASVPPPLAKPSGDGDTFPEASIPMETLSPSLAS